MTLSQWWCWRRMAYAFGCAKSGDSITLSFQNHVNQDCGEYFVIVKWGENTVKILNAPLTSHEDRSTPFLTEGPSMESYADDPDRCLGTISFKASWRRSSYYAHWLVLRWVYYFLTDIFTSFYDLQLFSRSLIVKAALEEKNYQNPNYRSTSPISMALSTVKLCFIFLNLLHVWFPPNMELLLLLLSHGYNILKFVDVFNWFNNYFLVLVGFSLIVLTTINMGMATYSRIVASSVSNSYGYFEYDAVDRIVRIPFQL